MVEMGSVDRISALPDELVTRILGFVSTREAVCTTVLSKRWKNLWTTVTTLTFHDGLDFVNQGDDFDEDDDYDGRFATFLTRFLYFRDSVDIQKCSLFLYNDRHHMPQVDDWLCAIARRNVVELELVVMYSIPQDLFRCKTLRIFKMYLLEYCDFDPPELGCLPNLKVLHGVVDTQRMPSFVNFVSRCPVIKVLTAEITVCGNYQGDVIQVSVPALKTLKISLENKIHSVEEVYIFINAPILENLHLTMDGSTIYSFYSRGMESLTDVSIDFGDFERKEVWCQIFSLLDIVSSARYLSVSASSLVPFWSEDWNLPAFGNLTRLELVLCDSDHVKLIHAFLNCAPVLKDIVLVCSTRDEEYHPMFPWNQPEKVPGCFSSHLKTVSITGFKGMYAEVEMAKYLLKNGLSLKKNDNFY